MCTVVFIPVKDNLFFASLRDEDPRRLRAIAPSFIAAANGNYIAPTDPSGGGAWLGANEFGNIIILLNGGFKDHSRKTGYSKSRGMIVKELLGDSMPVVEWNLMDLENVEPFTLVVWADEKLFQLVWDGKEKHRINLSPSRPHIWSSATLYDDDAKKCRSLLFKNWIASAPFISGSSLLNFFKKNRDNYNGFLVNRGDIIKTLSYTFIDLQKTKVVTMHYHDFTLNSSYYLDIPLLEKQQNCVS